MPDRGIVKIVASAIFCLCIVAWSCARQSSAPPFTLIEVGSNVWAAIDNPTAAVPAAANAGFVIGDDGVVVVDTFWSVDAARQLRSEIQKRTNLPAKYIINTHYHLDHQRFVPGHGDVASRDDVAAFRDYLTTLRAQVISERAQGKSGDVWLERCFPC